MKNKKWIILGTLGATTLVSAVVIPIVLLNSSNNSEKTKTDNEKTKTDNEKTKTDNEKTKTDNEKTKTDNEKPVEYYANKIQKILAKKVIKLDSANDSLYWQKNLIINKIKALDGFPTLPNYIKLRIESDLIKNPNAQWDGENFLEKPLSSEKLNSINLIIAKQKVTSSSMEETGIKIKFFVQIKSNLTSLDNYFSKKQNQKIFIPSSTLISSKQDILTFFKNEIISILNPTQQALDKISFSDGAITIEKGKANNIEVIFKHHSWWKKRILISFIHRTSDAQAIIDYFAQSGKKDLSIPGTTVISDKNSLTNAIQEALKSDDPSLFNDTKKAYVTIADDYIYSPFIKETSKEVKIKIQKGSEEPEFITLSITHLENNLESVESVENYFEFSKNQRIFIPSSTVISSASDILTAVKKIIGDDLTLTQKNLITLKENQPDSLTKGQFIDVDFGVTGGNDVTLSIFHNSSDFETTLKFFQKNPEYFIASSTSISSASDVLRVVKNAIGDELTQAQKALITVNNESVSLLKGEGTYISFSISEAKTILILVTQRSSEVQSIIDYFKTSKKQLSISESSIVNEIKNRTTLINAIRETLKASNPTLFDEEKLSYITLHNDYDYASFDNGISQNVKVIIQKDSETSEHITLSITYLKDSSSL